MHDISKPRKMAQKLSEIEPSVKKMSIVADFHKMQTMEEYKQIIGSQLKDLDIGVLAINAGFGNVGAFERHYDDEVEKVL